MIFQAGLAGGDAARPEGRRPPRGLAGRLGGLAMRPSGALPPPSPPSRLSGLFSFEFCASTRAAARFARFSRRRSDPTDFWPAVSFFPSLSFLFLRSLIFPLSSCLCLCLCLCLFLVSVDCSSLFVNGCFCFARPSRPGLRGLVGRKGSPPPLSHGRAGRAVFPSAAWRRSLALAQIPACVLRRASALPFSARPVSCPKGRKQGLDSRGFDVRLCFAAPDRLPPPIAFRFAGSLVDLSPPLFLPFFLSVFPSGFFRLLLPAQGLAVIFACAARAVSFFFDSLGPLAPFRPLGSAAGSRRPKAPGAGAAKVCLKLSKGE